MRAPEMHVKVKWVEYTVYRKVNVAFIKGAAVGFVLGSSIIIMIYEVLK